jgi:hypothetical protein
MLCPHGVRPLPVEEIDLAFQQASFILSPGHALPRVLELRNCNFSLPVRIYPRMPGDIAKTNASLL